MICHFAINRPATPRPSLPTLLTIAVIFLYTLLSFHHLGNPYAPSNGWESSQRGVQILLDFGEETEIGALSYYLGNYEKRRFTVEVGTGSPAVWEELPELEMKRVYQWGSASINRSCRFLRLTTINQYTDIKELVLTGKEASLITPANASSYPQLFDEQTMYEGPASFKTGTVFDESVFARTAYEHLHGLRSYEDTHPPLGKLMISIGIALFGMNPFGWRVSGAAAGVALLVLLWAFSRRLFQSRWITAAVVALFALDFLHFTESRLGQVDSFLVLFMTAMYYFMFRYGEALGERRGWRYLAASGISMGLAVSCKWSGLYGAAGLALIWAVLMTRSLSQGRITWRYAGQTALACCLFFLLIPAAIYLLSYLPYVAADQSLGFWERVWSNQVNMLAYHSQVSGYHSSASSWYEWPISARPVLLFSGRRPGGRAEILALMGNPALWWPGLLAVFYGIYRLLDGKDGQAAFLVTAYLAPMLPWIFISRYSFLYHYYPSLPFLTLLMGLLAERKGRRGTIFLGVCVLAAAVLFLLFYPIISGQTADAAYVTGWLQWLPTWRFLQ